MTIIGIDPGVCGAAAALLPGGTFVSVIDLPTTNVGPRREIDVLSFRKWLHEANAHRIVMENVHSMPRDGGASAFRFGVAVGMLKTLCNLRLGNGGLELVEPAVWKGYFELPGGDKEAARELALQLFPDMDTHLMHKKDHQKAEAMLIAWWATRPPIGRNW